MTNLDKAIGIVGELATEFGQPGGEELFGLDESVAQSLADAGLLMPDLPEPDQPEYDWYYHEWTVAHISTAMEGTEAEHEVHTTIWADGPDLVVLGTAVTEEHLTVAEARELACALLAAANYAEKEQNNEQS